MTIDPIDRDNMIRMIVAGRLSELRRYAKDVLRISDARRSMDFDGSPVMASLSIFGAPRKLPEIKVLDSTAINSARDLAATLKQENANRVGAQPALVDDAIEWLDTYIGPAPAEPITAPGGWCTPGPGETEDASDAT